MRTRADVEAALHALGWRVTDGPTRTSGGWKAAIEKGTASKLATGDSAVGVLDDLLRAVEASEGRP